MHEVQRPAGASAGISPDTAAGIVATAHRLADAARVETLRLFRSPDLHPDNKAQKGFDPVTEADRASERAMRAILAEARPDDAILGEEFGAQPGTSGLTWVLDPIDGTRAFMAGAPSWGVLIGVTAAELSAAQAKGKLRGALARAFKTGEMIIPDDLPGMIAAAQLATTHSGRP